MARAASGSELAISSSSIRSANIVTCDGPLGAIQPYSVRCPRIAFAGFVAARIDHGFETADPPPAALRSSRPRTSCSADPLAEYGSTPLIYSVSVKNMLGDIQTDCGNL
jgi:hypothetical protein